MSAKNKYLLQISRKTRILNFFRNIFVRPFDRVLRRLTIKHQSPFLYKLIPPNYLYKDPTVRTVSCNGTVMELNISHVVDHFLYFGIREHSLDRLFELAKPDHIILDIGANIGGTVIRFAKIAHRGFVYGFEPDKGSFERGMKNISLNGISNVSLMNIGLGDRSEEVMLYEVDKNNPGMNRVLSSGQDFPGKKITIRDLDSIVSELAIPRVDLVKIDVEGYEYRVLKGAKETIMKYKPALFIEVNEENLKDQGVSSTLLIELVRSYGYLNIIHAEKAKQVILSEYENFCADVICK